MTDRDRELRALLFGQPPYERPAAPEPELLRHLAPLLPEAVIEEAVRAISAIGVMVERERFRTLAALLERAAELGRTDLVGDTLVQWPRLAVHLPDALVPPALASVREVEWGEQQRAEALTKLAEREPSLGQEILIDEALATATRRPIYYGERRTLETLVGGLPGPLPEDAARRLSDSIHTIEDPDDRARLLVELAAHTTGPGKGAIVTDALETCRAVADIRLRAELLTDCALVLPDEERYEVFEEAFDSARSLAPDDYGRAELLVRLGLEAPQPLGEEAIEEAVAPAGTDEAVAPVEEGARVVDRRDALLGRALANLAERLPATATASLQRWVQDLHLPEEALPRLAPWLSEGQLVLALEALEYAWGESWVDGLAELAPRLSEELAQRALDIVETSDQEDRHRARALAAIAGHLPESALPRALSIATALDDDWWRRQALAALLPVAPGSEKERIEVEVRPVLGDRIRELFGELPEEERIDLVRRAVGGIWGFYGGAMAEAVGPEDEPMMPDVEEVEEDVAEEEAKEEVEAEEEFEPEVEKVEEAEAERDASEPWAYESAEPEEPERAPRASVSREDEPTTEPEPEGRPVPEEATPEEAVPEEAAPEEIERPERIMEEIAPAKEQRPPDPVVNTGFATLDDPATPAEATEPLRAGRGYYFWLQISAPVAGAIDVAPAVVRRDLLPEAAVLEVALFAFDDGFEIVPGADVGALRVQSSGPFRVVRPIAEPERLAGDVEKLLERRLFFPVSTPKRSGMARLRCNLYCKGVLVQSHLVEVEVRSPWRRRVERLWPWRLLAGRAATGHRALRTIAEYTISRSLRSGRLAALESHRLSILLNDNGDGTHGFRFFGTGETRDRLVEKFKQDASFPGQELQDFIDRTRGALRQAAWGSSELWSGQPYRYEPPDQPRDGPPGDPPRHAPGDLDRLRADLANLAKCGYRFWDAIVSRLAAGGEHQALELRKKVKELRSLMRTPGMIQMASKEGARHVVPLAMLYDHRLDDTARIEDYSLCPRFLDAWRAGEPLEETECFAGSCPSLDRDTVVCPSGFWGYRHQIGLPVSVGEGDDAGMVIECKNGPRLAVAVSTDPDFVRRPRHERALKDLRRGIGWSHADSREEALEVMRQASSHVVYFYCHGGIQEGVPYIQVGSRQERGITRALLRSQDVFWPDPQPLVFINGCHTTALEPESALDLVTGFVETSNAAGVIGTEITIFEPLACRFAEACLLHFLGGTPVGESVRRARLALLAEGNPLGLIYIPFVLASLKMTGGDDA